MTIIERKVYTISEFKKEYGRVSFELCPFCGSKPSIMKEVLEIKPEEPIWYVFCPFCNCSRDFASLEAQIRWWNNRVDS